jgi:hypothetical protein
MSEPDDGPPTSSEIVFYQGEDGQSRIQVRLDGETVWLTQRLLAELYQVTVPTINEHLANLYDEQELDPAATIRKFRIVQPEGRRQVSRLIDHYNLDVILAVGYRVRSHRGTQFRRWASERLREYVVKGFTLDGERLKEGRTLGADYFDELLERIREIRASEKRFYQKIRDLYTLAVDYDPGTAQTKEFFQIVQNKLHWAVTGRTAAEIIAGRADAEKPNMGLTAWKGVKVRRADVTVAKNYLSDDEIRQLDRVVTMYLDYAEEQAERRKPLYMRDWREKLDAFLAFNERDVLKDAGRVSMEIAQKLALDAYDTFERRRLAEEAAAPDELEDAAKRLGPGKPGAGRRRDSRPRS